MVSEAQLLASSSFPLSTLTYIKPQAGVTTSAAITTLPFKPFPPHHKNNMFLIKASVLRMNRLSL